MPLSTHTIPQRRQPSQPFPTGGAILLGAGLGGFFDGIVLHQVLQWHHIASSAGVSVDTVAGLERNTLLDGLFHGVTWLMTVAAIALLWRGARRGARLAWSGLIGGVLMGFGMFNLVEGVVNHQLLDLHHVNETVPRDQWLAWDIGFLGVGLILFALGAVVSRRARA